MVDLKLTTSIIALNVNGLNSPNKRHRLPNWVKKKDLNTCCLQEIHFERKVR